MDRNKIRKWMLAHKSEHIDPKTGDLNLTALVEAWDSFCDTGGATLDPDHVAWEVAVEINDSADYPEGGGAGYAHYQVAGRRLWG